MMKHIALFGGSFDPPHLGHQNLVEAALATLHFDEVWLIPVGIPVHRSLSNRASNQQRMSWLTQMFAAEPRVSVLDWEINQQKATPAIDTLSRFRTENPHKTPTWLMGMDSFYDLPNWVAYPAHQALCNLAVFHRKSHENNANTTGWEELSLQKWQLHPPQTPGHIVLIDADIPNISSTQVRQDLRLQQTQLPQSTCNAISACYAVPTNHKEERTLMNVKKTMEQLSAEVIEAIEDKKGQDIVILNVQGRCNFADQFILATGRTDRQLKALANGVRQVGHSNDLTARIDGMEGLEWLVVDLGDIVVHFFLAEVRESFQLERLWSTPEET